MPIIAALLRPTAGLILAAATPLAAQVPLPADPPDVPASADDGDGLLHPDLLETTLSVEGDLADDTTPRSTSLAPSAAPALQPWFAWKQRFEERTGINFGGSYGILYQHYTNSRVLPLPGGGTLETPSDAVSHKFTLNASVALANRGAPNALSFDIAIEDRRPFTDFAPLQAGVLAGSGLPTAATWGDFDIGITQAYIRQTVAGGKFQYTIGKIFAPNFVDAYPFFDDNRQFLNLAFSTSPTIAVPLRGFGFVGAVYPGQGNFYVKAGMFTANSSDTGWTVDDFFDRAEHFYFVEVGQTSFARRGVPIHARGPMDRNNLHITTWYRDPLKLHPGERPGLTRPAGEAYGVAFSINQMAGDNLMWFARGGVGKGGFAKANITAGLGWRPTAATANLAGAGFGWSKPEQPDIGLPLPRLRDQFVGEIFYRFHLTPNLAITPDYQLIVQPSLDPTRDTLSVFSIRARIAF